MITEDYISFEIAKLLKEKGFDKEVLAVYIYDNLFVKGENKIVNTANVPIIPAPTLQMAMKWLREVHHLLIIIRKDTHILEGFKGYFFVIESAKGGSNSPLGIGIPTKVYEEAVEAALKYSLENLI